VYVTQTSNKVIYNTDAPSTVNGIPAFSLLGWGDIESPNVADDTMEGPGFKPEDIDSSWCYAPRLIFLIHAPLVLIF
jgi:hypothetical protein